MAGIGMELRKLLNKRTLLGDLQAMFYSITISSGPWLFTCFSLAFLGIYFARDLTNFQQSMFRVTVVYCYAFSMILTGPIQLVTTRFLADQYYLGRETSNIPAFLTGLMLTLPIQTIVSVVFVSLVDATLMFKILMVLLYLTIGTIWLAMVLLSASKDYNSIIVIFLIGSILSMGASTSLGRFLGLDGLAAGFLLGQAFILFGLVTRLLVEFELVGSYSMELIKYFFKFWELAVSGFLLNFGIWADKFLFWIYGEETAISPPLYSYPLYETATFLAYIAVVPAMGYFLIKVEVDFYDRYRNFFSVVVHRQPYRVIHEAKKKMASSLKEGTRTIILVQGITTGLALYLSPKLLEILDLPLFYIGVVRVSIIGALLQGLFLLDVLILFYFDLRKEVLLVSLFFCISNVILTLVTIHLGFPFYGYGFTLASFLSLLLTSFLLEWGLRRFEYLTFTKVGLS